LRSCWGRWWHDWQTATPKSTCRRCRCVDCDVCFML
jgi:hypothetical protein